LLENPTHRGYVFADERLRPVFRDLQKQIAVRRGVRFDAIVRRRPSAVQRPDRRGDDGKNCGAEAEICFRREGQSATPGHPKEEPDKRSALRSLRAHPLPD
jgi:hypothetical protein